MRTFALLMAFVLLPLAAWADPAELASKLDSLYVERDDAAKLDEQGKLVERALAEAPDDYGILWRASRYKYWLADGASDKSAREKWGRESWELGERAVKANPEGVEGNYYSAIGLGVYSQGVGILRALTQGLEGKFNARLDKAIQLDPALDNAGPLIAKGRYFYELPWPKRNLGESKKTLEKALTLRPSALRAFLYLAETQLADGDAKKAQRTLSHVPNGAEGYDKAEARRIKEQSRSVQAKIEEELK